MSTSLNLECDGCDKTEKVSIRRSFESFNGKGYGFGVFHVPTIDEAVSPTGWVWADLIGCTYCPECWGQIEASGPDEGGVSTSPDLLSVSPKALEGAT